MALGFNKSSGSGDFLPVFKFNAVSGDAVVASSVKNEKTGEYDKDEKEVKFPTKFIFDMENIEVGYMHFAATGPDFAMVKLGSPLPAKPSAEHKQGFRVKLYSKEYGVSMFSNSSKTISEVMDQLHDAYVAGAAKNEGKVPVVEIKGTKKVSVKTKEGAKNYKQPDWSIVSWVARPEALTEKKVEPAQEASEIDDVDEF